MRFVSTRTDDLLNITNREYELIFADPRGVYPGYELADIDRLVTAFDMWIFF
jgi:hypothetical protein